MATIYNLIVTAQDSATADAQRDLIAESNNQMLAGLKIKDFFKTLISGIRPGSIQTKVNCAKASGTITLAAFVQNDTITINGVGFTGKDSPAAATEFQTGVSDTATAASFATVANTNATLDGMVIVTSATSVITITALVPGELGNAVTTAISAHGTAAGARLTGGTNGDAERQHYFGSVAGG